MALHAAATAVTVAESNRAVLQAFHADVIRKFTGDILSKVRVIDYEGRHFLAHTDERFDVIDLSLANSVGLSNPGGFAIMEKFSYTKEAMQTYMRALAPGGVLSVTLWNKEEPPKSVLKLYATVAEAAREVDPELSQLLLRRIDLPLDGDHPLQERRFRPGGDRDAARPHASMSLDEIYSPASSMIRRKPKARLPDMSNRFLPALPALRPLPSRDPLEQARTQTPAPIPARGTTPRLRARRMTAFCRRQ